MTGGVKYCIRLPDRANMRALSIRQPYAEMILRGIKTVEYRSRPTKIIGERFWIYASKGPGLRMIGPGKEKKLVWSHDLAAPVGDPPAWMLEMWELMRRGELLTGVIVGSAVIDRVTRSANSGRAPNEEMFNWHLSDVRRIDMPRKPLGHPQPVWFKAF